MGRKMKQTQSVRCARKGTGGRDKKHPTKNGQKELKQREKRWKIHNLQEKNGLG